MIPPKRYYSSTESTEVRPARENRTVDTNKFVVKRGVCLRDGEKGFFSALVRPRKRRGNVPLNASEERSAELSRFVLGCDWLFGFLRAVQFALGSDWLFGFLRAVQGVAAVGTDGLKAVTSRTDYMFPLDDLDQSEQTDQVDLHRRVISR